MADPHSGLPPTSLPTGNAWSITYTSVASRSMRAWPHVLLQHVPSPRALSSARGTASCCWLWRLRTLRSWHGPQPTVHSPPLPQRDRVLLLEAVTYTREQAFTMVGTIANVNTQFTRLQQDHQLVNGGAGAAVNGMCVCAGAIEGMRVCWAIEGMRVCWAIEGMRVCWGYRGNAGVLGLSSECVCATAIHGMRVCRFRLGGSSKG